MDTEFNPIWVDQLTPTEVYKQDARSRVWRIDSPDGRVFVIKRFEFNPCRQLLGIMTYLHPGRRERRRSAQLIAAGIAVVPVIASGVQRHGLGLRLWLATPYVGVSLFNLLYHRQLTDAAHRARILNAVGRLTKDLMSKGYFNRDHKASNILIDAQDRPYLIDYGSVRRGGRAAGLQRMLASLCANLAEAGASDADLDRVRLACVAGAAADSSRQAC